VVNRAAIILQYKEPAIRWINDADPYEKTHEITAADVNDDRTVYLISTEDGDGAPAVDRWIKRNYKTVFEEELEGWYTDPSLWPQMRTLKLFREWFDVECHSVLIDTVGSTIHDDDI
jgi:hypothetical protein